MLKKRNIVLYIITHIDLIFSALCLSVLVLLTVVAVFVRYVISSPFSWIEEIQLLLFLYTVLFGASVAFRYGGHIAIEILVELFPVCVQRIIEFLTTILVFATLAMMAGLQFQRGYSLLLTGRTTNILAVPMSLIYSGAGLAFLIMMIRFTGWYVRSLKNLPENGERS